MHKQLDELSVLESLTIHPIKFQEEHSKIDRKTQGEAMRQITMHFTISLLTFL